MEPADRAALAVELEQQERRIRALVDGVDEAIAGSPRLGVDDWRGPAADAARHSDAALRRALGSLGTAVNELGHEVHAARRSVDG